MPRKVFVSYKYADSSVYKLRYIPYTSVPYIQKTTARDYVNELVTILGKENHIYKGEQDGQSLADFRDSTIESKLRDKIYDSSITIVLISKNMKDSFRPEKDQWIPWEISYSLKEISRKGRVSKSNAIFCIALPDENNSYNYCLNQNLAVLRIEDFDFSNSFKILEKNTNNRNKYYSNNINDILLPNLQNINNSYIFCVRWEEFIKNSQFYFEKAEENKRDINYFNMTKTIEE
jgi:hypothetical protein